MNLITRLRMLLKLRRNDSGQDLLEYALLVALIALVAVGAITTTGHGCQHDLRPTSATALARRGPVSQGSRRMGTGTRQRSVLLFDLFDAWYLSFAIGRQVEHRHMTAFIVRLTRTLRHRDEGQDLLEYALLVALIALGAVGAITTVGETVSTVFWDAIAAAI